MLVRCWQLSASEFFSQKWSQYDDNYRKPRINREMKQLKKVKVEYFQLKKLEIITVTENNIFKNKVKKLIEKAKSHKCRSAYRSQ